jgi:heme iron utilization protein
LEGDKNVSLLIDNRAQQPDSLNKISAVTITGKARILSDKDEMEKWSGLYLEKHPYLNGFVKSPSTAMVLVEVLRYFYVSRFQEVFEWSPSQNS